MDVNNPMPMLKYKALGASYFLVFKLIHLSFLFWSVSIILAEKGEPHVISLWNPTQY